MNGIAPIVLSRIATDALTTRLARTVGLVTVDLDMISVVLPDGVKIGFSFDGESRAMLRERLNTIDLTLRHANATLRTHDRALRPWAYP